MLEILSTLSTQFQPYRKWSYLVAVFFIGVIATHLLQTQKNIHVSDAYAMLSFVGLIWLLLFNILLTLFDNIPSIDIDSTSMISRIKYKIKRSFYHVLALLFFALTLIIIFLSVRMLRI